MSDKTTNYDIFSKEKTKKPSDKIVFKEEKEEKIIIEKTEAEKKKEADILKKKKEAQNKRKEAQKKREADAEAEKQTIKTELSNLRDKNKNLTSIVNKLQEEVGSFKDLSEELTTEAERDLEASKLLGKFAELKKSVKTLNSKNKKLSALYDIKTEAYKTNENLFQLDLDKIRKAIIHNFPEIKNWKDLTAEDRLRLSPETYSIQATINRVWSGRVSYLEDYVQIINTFPNECVSEAYIPEKLDSKTLEVIKEYLMELMES